MPVIRPFKAVIYNKEKIRDLSKVVAPPYDIIPKEMQDTLYRRSLYNIVRLELAKICKGDDDKDNRYTRAGRDFESWLKDRILVQDRSSAIYAYSQKYLVGLKPIERIGFIALMEIDPRNGSKVLPHENTLAAPKKDRLELMRATKANLSSIFVLYDDPRHYILSIINRICKKKKAAIDINWDGVRQRVWKLDEPEAILKIQKIMMDKEIFIADGHHRFETSRNFAKEIRRSDAPREMKNSAGSIMVYFAESDERTLTILPAHRIIRDTGRLSRKDVLHKIAEYFYIKEAPGLKGMMTLLSKLSGSCAFGMYAGGGKYSVLKLKDAKAPDKLMKDKPAEWKKLDVAILHQFLFQHVLGVSDDDDNVEFLKDPKDTVKYVDSGKGKIAFFLNPTKVSQVKRIAKLGEKMPRKATYFYPKPISGLVINKI